MRSIFALIILFALTLLSGCGEGNKGRTLPSSQGKEFQITVVVDGALENAPHVEALKESLYAPYPMTGAETEPYFGIRWLEAKNFGDLTQKNRYIILLATHYEDRVTDIARKIFTEGSMQRIEQDTSKYLVVGHDVWAKGQELMYLGSVSPGDLALKIEKGAQNIREHFYKLEFARIQKNLFKIRERLNREYELEQAHQVKLRLPEAYNDANMAVSRDSILEGTGFDGFEWFVFDGRKSMINVVLTYVDYEGEEQLTLDSIIATRNRAGRYLPCGPEGSYLGTDTRSIAPQPIKRIMDLNGHYAIETLGWWTCVNSFSAGPFVNYTVIDKKRNRIVYLDGFIAAKGEPKKSYLVRLKSILQTIDFD